jgi:hypothetical protein
MNIIYIALIILNSMSLSIHLNIKEKFIYRNATKIHISKQMEVKNFLNFIFFSFKTSIMF